MTFPDDITVTNRADLQDGMFIGDEPRKCWEASLREVCSFDSDSTSAEGTGAHSPMPTTISLHAAISEGSLPSVTAVSDAAGLGEIQKIALKVGVTDLPYFPDDEPIKVPIEENSWLTHIGQLRSTNNILEKLILMEVEKIAVKADVTDLPFFPEDEPIKVPIAENLWPTKIAQLRSTNNILEKLILVEIEKLAVKADVTDLKFSSEDEPIKVPVTQDSWPTQIAHLRSSNPTETEVSAQFQPESFSQEHLREDLPSLVSMGCPSNCKSVCKYNKKSSLSAQAEPASFSQEHLRQDIPSLGSMGHPFSCKSACKYSGKRSGCKDGATCDRCHLCCWSPAVNLRLRKQLPHKSKKNAF